MKRLLLATALAWPALQGCSPRAAATRLMANALSEQSGGGAFAEDDDPELVGAAIPFALKTMEALLRSHPDHEGLLTSLASGFTQYAYAFVQVEADESELSGKVGPAQAGRARAKKLYLRARDYGLRGLEARHQGIAARLRAARDLERPLAELTREDLPLAYWTAASWALAIASGKDDMRLVAELPVPGALVRRALALDETWSEGALHEFLVSWEALQGGPDGFERARQHRDRALELSQGKKLGVLVSYAESVCVPRQDKAEFHRLLQQVLAADVEAHREHRLANVLAQRRARFLLSNVEELFA